MDLPSRVPIGESRTREPRVREPPVTDEDSPPRECVYRREIAAKKSAENLLQTLHVHRSAPKVPRE